ncbi:MAG: hypothetical protein QGH42_04725 [Kiritimatiellia bacterium]|jgi:hypothetical protein|nr:hypothetical protein [Kiritimatiellia bacterium]MDP6631279.1 hypothetical protein [Kiritimatiellia bacterium]MDP6809610.1 hypothetical protein [Kiritimatiellia bacterium]MDP7023539.1 hypothetical protein [Kiritimatiellia bacterium]
MKRAIFAFAMIALLAAAPLAQANEEQGDILGFFVGCCFGLRTGADYNDGKELHLRDYGRIIPWANIVFAVWDGVDTYNGKGRADFQTAYGSEYY